MVEKKMTKAQRVRTLVETFADTCDAIKAALRARGQTGKHDDREIFNGKRHHRQWFVGEGEAVARICIEEKTTWRGPNPADPKLVLNVTSQPVRDAYSSKAQTVPFKQKADGTWNVEAVVSAAINMVERRKEEAREVEERKASRQQEQEIETAEVEKLPNQGGRGSSQSFSTRSGWSADRLRGQPVGGNPVYVFAAKGVRMPLSHLREVVDLLRKFEHADHGRGDDAGPDEKDCLCRVTDQRNRCALLGCGFCSIPEDEESGTGG